MVKRRERSNGWTSIENRSSHKKKSFKMYALKC